MNTQTTNRPDLSALPRDVRVRIAVAETQGAAWVSCGEGRWQFKLEDAQHRPLFWSVDVPATHYGYDLETDENYNAALPDYLTDPAAWGALMEREGVIPAPFLDGWRGIRPDRTYGTTTGYPAGIIPEGIRIVGPYTALVPTIGEAVCASVLAKYNIGWTTLEPIA